MSLPFCNEAWASAPTAGQFLFMAALREVQIGDEAVDGGPQFGSLEIEHRKLAGCDRLQTAAFSHCKFKPIAFLVDDKENVALVERTDRCGRVSR